MTFFIAFILGAILLGAGAMLAPAWPTTQPRVGLAAALSLALVVGGAVWWASAFGWSTLVVDYLLFALVSLVVLGGTMAQAQERAEEAGEELADDDVGWPGPEDLAFFAVVMLLCITPLIVFNVPAGEQAASQSTMSLIARDGGIMDLEGNISGGFIPFTSATPSVIAPPAFHALSAYLSHSLKQPVPLIELAIGSVLALLAVWVAYDLGSEIRNKRLGRTFALATIMTGGSIYMLVNSFYSGLMALVFGLAFMTYGLRYLRAHHGLDMIGAGLMLGMMLYVSPPLFLLLLLTYYAVLLVYSLRLLFRRQPSKTGRQHRLADHLGAWVGVALVCAFGVAPYVWRSLPHMDYDFYGLYFFMTRDNQWLFALYAIMTNLIGGGIIYGFFRMIPARGRVRSRPLYYPLLLLFASLIVGAGWWIDRQVDDPVPMGNYAAMQWVRDNTVTDALILNVGEDWVYPFTDRPTWDKPNYTTDYNFREQLSHDGSDLLTYQIVYQTAETEATIRQYGVDYLLIGVDTPFTAPNYLERVFEQDGARVYRVLP